ncbi:unnamed protein product [Blepharisma stoltei]|uniref:Uncharacterized protein n=1 Tax=Blepharisma stoltei TaxID=1481888 RepID=A0AAU9JYI8_9CILI|nr:unnamed protein product [Blepharisma stoltei]
MHLWKKKVKPDDFYWCKTRSLHELGIGIRNCKNKNWSIGRIVMVNWIKEADSDQIKLKEVLWKCGLIMRR